MHTLVSSLLLSWRRNLSDIYLVVWTSGQGFRFLRVLIQWSEFIVVLQGKKFTRTTPLSSQKITTLIFPADGTLLNFIIGNVIWSFHWLLLGFGFQVEDSGFIPHDSLWQKALISGIILVQKSVAVAFIVCNCLVSFYASVSMSGTEGAQSLE